MRHAILLGACAVVLSGSGLAFADASTSAERQDAIVSPAGIVGDLQIDRSTEASIRTFAGTPAFSGEGSFETASAGYPKRYRVLAFDCTGQHDNGLDPGAYRPTHLYCRSVYYLNPSTHRLAAFWTNSPRFRTAAGTRPGTRQAVADRLEHQHAMVGALAGITL